MEDKTLDLALLVLRIAVGVIFVAHGLQKLPMALFDGPGIDGMTQALKGMGFASPGIWAWVLALGEFLGGLFLLAGVLPRFSAAVIAIIMLVAIIKVHGPNGFFAKNGGFEYPWMILGACITLMLTGAGRMSLFNKW